MITVLAKPQQISDREGINAVFTLCYDGSYIILIMINPFFSGGATGTFLNSINYSVELMVLCLAVYFIEFTGSS